MSRASVLVFFLEHGAVVSVAVFAVCWAVCFVAGHVVFGRLRARALRRRLAGLAVGKPLEGELLEGGVRVDGCMVRFQGARRSHGPRPRLRERVLAWGEPGIHERSADYRAAPGALTAPEGGSIHVVAKRALDHWSPRPLHAAALALPAAWCFWLAGFRAVQPWVTHEIVIRPAIPARDAIAKTITGERLLLPMLVGLASPFTRDEIRGATARALNGACESCSFASREDEDSPITGNEMRALTPLLAAFSDDEVDHESRVRLLLGAGDVRRAVKEGKRSQKEDARDLAARAALSFGFFDEAASLGPTRGDWAVSLAALTGDFRKIRDAAISNRCVRTWAEVRLGETSADELHVRCAPKDGNVGSVPFMQFLWESLQYASRIDDGTAHYPNLGWLASPPDAAAKLSKYESRFVIPPKCPEKIELRYAADALIGQCLRRAKPVDPFLGEGSEKDGTWASWWQRMFTSFCIAPSVDPKQNVDHLNIDVWCNEPVGSESWDEWWHRTFNGCVVRDGAEIEYGGLWSHMIEGLSIAACSNMKPLESELRHAVASMRAAVVREAGPPLLW